MKTLLLLLIAAALHGQTVVNGGRTFLGPVDASGATSTKPAKSGASDPGTCGVGELFFNTTAATLKQCTATNTWSAIGGTSSSASTAFAPTRETGSATNDTIRLNCDTAPYCTQTINRVIAFNATTDITFKISASPSYTGNVYIYYTPSAQTIYCDQGSAGLTLTLAGCTAATTGGIPAGSLPVGKYNGTYAVSSNVFADPSTSPVAPTVWARTLSGTGVDCSDNATTGEQTCVTDSLIPLKSQIQGQELIYAASTGSSNAYLLTTSPSFSANANGVCVEFKANFTNSGTATLAVNGGIARELWKHNGTSAAAAAASGEIISGQIYRACHNTTLNTSGAWVVINIGGGGGSSSPLTTKGDLHTYSTTDTRLPVSGNNGKILVEDSAQATGMKWAYISREDWIPAGGGCTYVAPGWNPFLTLGEPGGIGCGSGYATNMPKQFYLAFNDAADQYYGYTWRLPSNFSALTSITYHYATDGTSGNVAVSYGAVCYGSSDAWLGGTPAFTDDAVIAVPASATNYVERSYTHTTSTLDGCGAGGKAILKIARLGSTESATDTNANAWYLFGMTLKYTVKAE